MVGALVRLLLGYWPINRGEPSSLTLSGLSEGEKGCGFRAMDSLPLRFAPAGNDI